MMDDLDKEDFKFNASITANMYHTPGYLTTRDVEPELDQYEEDRNNGRRRRVERLLQAYHRRGLRDKLREREKLVKDRLVADEEKYLWDEVEKERQRLQDGLDLEKQRLIDEQKLLEKKLLDMKEDVRKLILARAE